MLKIFPILKFSCCCFFLLIRQIECQKLLVIVLDGFAGSFYYKYGAAPAFRMFETKGVWTDMLYPEFPSLSLPNRQTLVTGLHARHHNFVGDYLVNDSSKDVFRNFEVFSDYDLRKWWHFEPIYITAVKESANVALFNWPECKIPWPKKPAICRGDKSEISSRNEIQQIVACTRDHDLVMVYHRAIQRQAARIGPSAMTSMKNSSIDRIARVLGYFLKEVSSRIDLNLLVVSTHGMVDVAPRRLRYLDDFLDMNLIETTVGYGAVKQIRPYPGKTHQIFDQLRNQRPIPNVKIYYTTPRMGDLPEWYGYARSNLVPELVLVAQPGFAILTRARNKQIPQLKHKTYLQRGFSGYNNHFPDMLGIFLALGPVFKKGQRKGPSRLVDIYPLMCHILNLNCPQSDGNLSNFADTLTVDPINLRKLSKKIGVKNSQNRCEIGTQIFIYFSIYYFVIATDQYVEI